MRDPLTERRQARPNGTPAAAHPPAFWSSFLPDAATARRHLPFLALIAALALIELVLTGADLALWGRPGWRMQAYAFFSFRPILWSTGWQFWPGQWLAMPLTHVFIHVGLVHMAGNALSLILLLRLLGWMRPWALLAVALGSALGGALAFWAFAPALASMTGASGAVSGLAAFWILRRLRQHPMRWQAVAAILVLLAVLSAIEALPAISTAWQGHLGGAVAGALLSGLWRVRPHPLV